MTLRSLPPPEVSVFDFDSDIRDGIRPPFYQEVSEDWRYYCTNYHSVEIIWQKIFGKIFFWIDEFLEIFLPWTYIANNNSCLLTLPLLNMIKLLVLSCYTSLATLFVQYTTLLTSTSDSNELHLYVLWGAVWLFWACTLYSWLIRDY